MWDLPWPGIEPPSPPLAGRFLTTGPPEKSLWGWVLNTSWKLPSPIPLPLENISPFLLFWHFNFYFITGFFFLIISLPKKDDRLFSLAWKHLCPWVLTRVSQNHCWKFFWTLALDLSPCRDAGPLICSKSQSNFYQWQLSNLRYVRAIK